MAGRAKRRRGSCCWAGVSGLGGKAKRGAIPGGRKWAGKETKKGALLDGPRFA